MKAVIKQWLSKYPRLYGFALQVYRISCPIIAVLERIQYLFLRVITFIFYYKYSNETCYLVDVTKIAHIDFGTGTQRVVRNLVVNLSNIDTRFVPVRLTNGSEEIVWASKWMRNTLDLSLRDKVRYMFSVPNIDRAGTYIILDELSKREEALRRKIFPRLSAGGVSIVTVIYDLIPVNYSKFCTKDHVRYFLRFLELVICHSKMLLCISRSVENEVRIYIEENFNKYKDIRICSWPLGFELGRNNRIGRKNNLISEIEGCINYLMVGTVNEHKGYDVAVKAFKQLWESGIDVNLCIVGQRGWNDDYFKNNIDSIDSDNFYYFGQLDDASLDFVYQNSKCLIQASYTEGYGLPVVEAASRGLGIIASDIPVMREITEEKAIFFSAGKSDQLYEAVKSIEEERCEISGISDFKTYSWYESAHAFRRQIKSL